MKIHFKLPGIKKIFAVLLCSVVLTGSLTYSYKNFISVSADTTIEDLDKQKEENLKKIDDLENTIAALEDDASKKQEYYDQLQEKIDIQNENIGILFKQIEDLNTQITDKQTAIDQLGQEIADQEVKIQEGLEEFKGRLRAMYISGNESLASVLVGSKDFYDMLSKMELVKRIAKHDDELIDNLTDELEQYNKNVENLKTEKAKLEVDLTDLNSKKDEVQTAINQLSADALKTQSELDEINEQRSVASDSKAGLEEANKDIEEQQAAILEEIKRQQEEAKAKEEAARLAAQQQQQSNNNSSDDDSSSDDNSGSGYSGGSLLWPVPGYYWVSSPFAMRWGSMHRGIDIAGGGISGAPIVAAESGTVSIGYTGCTHNYGKDYSCGCGGGYGNYLTIYHGNGLTTLYGHCASIVVSDGEYVERGEVIAYVGSTGYSTGFHLHFEVIENGSNYDPMNYLT